jgi:hypothetical protein
MQFEHNGLGRKKTYWNIPFCTFEYEKLKVFKKNKFTNYIVLILANKSFTNTWIAVLDYEKCLNCLSNTTQQGNRGIRVTRIGSERIFYYTGVGKSEKEPEKCLFDYITYFEKSENKSI